jgi:hypothetical protein
MRRVALLAAILALVIAATAQAAPPPSGLTHKFPLGTQTLCCQSHSATTPKQSTQAPPKQSATTPKSAPSKPAPAATTPKSQPATTAPTTHKSTRKGHSSSRDWILIALVAGVILVVGLDLILVRRSRRVDPRIRRHIPKPLLLLLAPIYRHDDDRDAWVLRLIGTKLGPVLRPNGYVPRAGVDEPDEDEPAVITASRAPDPFMPRQPGASPSRPRRSKANGNGSGKRAPSATAEQEPPPLVIRRRSD